MNIEYLKYFAELAKTQHYGQAAKALNKMCIRDRLDTLHYLYRDIKGRRENLSPLLDVYKRQGDRYPVG